jgi:hypothetical protein
MIFGTFSTSNRFADITRAPKLSLTYFFVMIYTPLQCLDGQTSTRRLTRLARPKIKFLFSSYRYWACCETEEELVQGQQTFIEKPEIA